MTRNLDQAYIRAQEAADKLATTATTFSNLSNDVLYGSFGGAIGSLVGVSAVLATSTLLAVPVIVPLILVGTTGGVIFSRERRAKREARLTIQQVREEMEYLPDEASSRMRLALENKYIGLLEDRRGELALPPPRNTAVPLLENNVTQGNTAP